MGKYISFSTVFIKYKKRWNFVYNYTAYYFSQYFTLRGGEGSCVFHFLSQKPFPSLLTALVPVPRGFFPSQEFIAFSHGLWLTDWFCVAYLVSLNPLLVEVFFPVESGSQRRSTMHCLLLVFHNEISKHSAKLGGYFSFHLGTAPSFPCVIIWPKT